MSVMLRQLQLARTLKYKENRQSARSSPQHMPWTTMLKIRTERCNAKWGIRRSKNTTNTKGKKERHQTVRREVLSQK